MAFQPGRLRREWETMAAMIGCYCRGHHGTGGELCPDCRRLLDYATERRQRCPYGETKPTCAKCPIHCFQPEVREKVKARPRVSFSTPPQGRSYFGPLSGGITSFNPRLISRIPSGMRGETPGQAERGGVRRISRSACDFRRRWGCALAPNRAERLRLVCDAAALRSSGRGGGALGLTQSRGCPHEGQGGVFRDAMSRSGAGPDGWKSPSAVGRRPAAASATPPMPDQVAWGEGKTVTQGGVTDSKRQFCTLRITKLAVETFRGSF